MKVLYVYRWATLGGVERVFVNRALAFKQAGLAVQQGVFFQHDRGGKAPMRAYIRRCGLERHLVVEDDFQPDLYDLVMTVDTPDILEHLRDRSRVFLECHTPYPEHRAYLRHLPQDIRGIIVPSPRFRETVQAEVSGRLRTQVQTLRNCVPRVPEVDAVCCFPDAQSHGLTPIVHIGRVDALKNVTETVEILCQLRRLGGDRFMLLVVGQVNKESDFWDFVRSKRALGRVVCLPPVPFHRVGAIHNFTERHGGAFVSSSKSESFGLSVAEAISADVPVMLSENNLHPELVDADTRCLYPLGQPAIAAEKLLALLAAGGVPSETAARWKAKFDPAHFIEDWRRVMEP